MATPLPDPGPHSVIVTLPEIDADELVPTCEVLRQENYRLWSIPIGRVEELAQLRRLFGRRAAIGVHNVSSTDQVGTAVAAGACFVASSFMLVDLVAAAGKVPVVLGGFTPSELRAGLRAGAAAVQLVPTDAFGTAFARILPDLLEYAPLIATGRMEKYQADIWREAGAWAVWPQDLVSVDLITEPSLDDLRVRLQQWALDD